MREWRENAEAGSPLERLLISNNVERMMKRCCHDMKKTTMAKRWSYDDDRF